MKIRLAPKRPGTLCPYLLSIAFVLSFLQYFEPLESKTIQLIPVAAFLAAGYVAFIDCSRKRRLATAIFAMGPIMGAVALAAAISSFMASEEAMLYGILMLAVLPAARFILKALGFRGVLEAYHRASIVSLVLAVIAGLDMILSAARGGRLQLLAFHPNLIALTLVSFVVVQVWGWRAGGRLRWVSLLCACVSTWLLVLTNSRGSLAALAAAGFLCIMFLAGRAIRQGRLLTRSNVFLCCLGALLLTLSLPLIYTKADYWYYSALEKLDLNTHDRGLHSGLSGRVATWSQTVDMLGDGAWLQGRGFRTSEDQVGAIDNGYLVLLYECGLLTALVVVVRYAQAMWHSGQTALGTAASSQALLPLALCCLLCAFLANNILERMLFGYGNPFSLLGLFFVVSDRADYAFSAGQSSPRVSSCAAVRFNSQALP